MGKAKSKTTVAGAAVIMNAPEGYRSLAGIDANGDRFEVLVDKRGQCTVEPAAIGVALEQGFTYSKDEE